MSGLHLFSRRGTTADHPGSGTAYRGVANLARFLRGRQCIFGRPSGSQGPGGLRISGSAYRKTQRKRPDDCSSGLAVLSFRRRPEQACALSGGYGADKPGCEAGAVLRRFLLGGKNTVPGDLNAVCGVEDIQHGHGLLFGVDIVVGRAIASG